MTMAVAPPPPLQIEAQPYSPFFNKWARVTTILQPEEPIGWPRATAPPATFTLLGSTPSN